MGSWYRVVKTIKGRRYLYAQRTWREGKHVRTENRYLGPAGEDAGASRPDPPAPPVTTTTPVFDRDLLHDRTAALADEGGDFVQHDRSADRPLRDVYSDITDAIIADLEHGVRPWDCPWRTGPVARPLRHNGEPYRGINVFMLWRRAVERGYASRHWMTFRQAQELGGHVRKGERGTRIAYASTFTRVKTDEHGKPLLDDDGKELKEEVPFLKAYTVFNADQIDGLPDRFHEPIPDPLDPETRIRHADEFIEATGAEIRHGGHRAYYSPATDHVQLPHFEAFENPEAYVATAVHELVHWTGHPTRLAREFGRERWGDEGYAMEELVAELGAAFVCADLGISPKPRDEHAPYIASWLKVLKNDKRAIVHAAAHAQRAADYLNGERGEQQQPHEQLPLQPEKTHDRTPPAGSLAFHGARVPFTDDPLPSAHGQLGAGFYLSRSRKRAFHFARWDPRIAADAAKIGQLPPPRYEGAVGVFDLAELNLLTVEHYGAFVRTVNAKLGVTKDYITPADLERFRELIAREGYDGIELQHLEPGDREDQIVIFPEAVPKVRRG